MSDLQSLIAKTLDYPAPTSSAYLAEMNTILEAARPDFSALGAHLVGLQGDDFQNAIEEVHLALKSEQSPYRIRGGLDGFDSHISVKHAVMHELMMQPGVTEEQRNQAVGILSNLSQYSGTQIKGNSGRWAEEKEALLQKERQDLQQLYGSVGSFDENGPKQVSPLKMDNWFNNSPTHIALAAAAVTIGTAASLGTPVILGAIAIGKVVFDVSRRMQYNEAVVRHDQLEQGLANAQTAGEGQAIYSKTKAELPVEESKFKHEAKRIGVMVLGLTAATVAAGAAPAIGVGMAAALAIGGASVAGVAVGKGMADVFKEHAIETLAERAAAQVKIFSERLTGRREGAAAEAEQTNTPQRPSGP